MDVCGRDISIYTYRLHIVNVVDKPLGRQVTLYRKSGQELCKLLKKGDPNVTDTEASWAPSTLQRGIGNQHVPDLAEGKT